MKDALQLGRDTRDEVTNESAELLRVANTGMEIPDLSFPYIQNRNASHLNRVREMVDPPKCEACPFHASLNNAHFCGWEACMKRKQAAWKIKENEEAARRLEIALYTPDDGAFTQLYLWKEGDRDLFGQRDPDLRLMPSRSQIFNNFEGVPSALMVVAVGETVTTRAAAEAQRTEQERRDDATREAEREARARQTQILNIRSEHVCKFGWEIVPPAFAAILESMTTYPLLTFYFEDVAHFTDSDLLIPDAAIAEGAGDFDRLVTAYEEANTNPKRAAVLAEMRRVIA
jgi:hypothetical protein